MKPSDKFANLGPSGIARQLAPKGGDAAKSVIQKQSVEKSVSNQPKFDRAAYQRDYMRDYMRKKRAADKARKRKEAKE